MLQIVDLDAWLSMDADLHALKSFIAEGFRFLKSQCAGLLAISAYGSMLLHVPRRSLSSARSPCRQQAQTSVHRGTTGVLRRRITPSFFKAGHHNRTAQTGENQYIH